MATAKRTAHNDDDDLYWDDTIDPTYNNLMMVNDAKKPKKTEEEQKAEWNQNKDLILTYFARQCGYNYLVTDLQKVINKFAGFAFEWKWSLDYISNSLSLYDGYRKVVCCCGPSWTFIHGKHKIFDYNSISIEEMVKFKINRCEFNIKIGIYSCISSDYIWFNGKKISTKIEMTGMSQMKQEMFGSIFGHLATQQKGITLGFGLKSGDIIQMRLSRKDRNAKYCIMEVRHNNGNWETIHRQVAVPVVPSTNLYSIGDSVSFVR